MKNIENFKQPKFTLVELNLAEKALLAAEGVLNSFDMGSIDFEIVKAMQAKKKLGRSEKKL